MSNHRQTGALIILALSLFFIFLVKTTGLTGFKRAATIQSPVVRPVGVEPAGETPIDINSASFEELKRLPGVGDTLAKRIIEKRETLGADGFKSVEELKGVRGIGEKKLELMRGRATLGGRLADDAEPGR